MWSCKGSVEGVDRSSREGRRRVSDVERRGVVLKRIRRCEQEGEDPMLWSVSVEKIVIIYDDTNVEGKHS